MQRPTQAPAGRFSKGCTALRKEPINRLLAVARNSSLNSSSTDMRIQEKLQNLKDSSKLGWEW